MSKVKLIIPASGSGIRFGAKVPKQFLKINGKEIIAMAIGRFEANSYVDEIIISAKQEYFNRLNKILRKNGFKKVSKVIRGGRRRQDSVYNALNNITCNDDDIILIHDAVRPFVSSALINKLILAARKHDAVIPGMPVNETLKEIDSRDFVRQTVDRNVHRLIQTPQAFRYSVLSKSFAKAVRENFTGTDESAIVENAGYKVKVIEGEKTNIKITLKGDLKNH